MADKEPTIVIKKVTVVAGGAHGGAWKVAFADFMTAMMAFFLVMWLLATADTNDKQNIADYFSTPSIVEYQFSNYGVELTLEKLFLDLVNEPLKFLQSFIKPIDKTPNFMAMGSKKVVLHHLADQLGEIAQGVDVSSDRMEFEIPARYLFLPGEARESAQFIEVIEKIKGITVGLEDSNIYVDSVLYNESVKGASPATTKAVAGERLDLVKQQIETTLENPSVDTYGRIMTGPFRGDLKKGEQPDGAIKIRIEQKDKLSDGRKPRKLEDLFGKPQAEMDVYENFVQQVANRKKRPAKTERTGR